MTNPTLPPLADGPNGAPRFSRAALVASKSTAALLGVTIIVDAVVNAALPGQPVVADLFYATLGLALLSALLFFVHLSSRPTPTRAEFAQAALVEAGELLALARAAEDGRPLPRPRRATAALTAAAHTD